MRRALPVLAALATAFALAAPARPQLSLKAGSVNLRWTGAVTTIYRSTRSLTPAELQSGRYPVTVFRVSGQSWTDPRPPQGVELHYQVGGQHFTTRLQAPVLPRLHAPEIRVDKLEYRLEVWDSGRMLRRFPVALGRNPTNRKLCYDNASTPEGVYRIVGTQPEATFYKAYDLDYPNATDRARYELADAGHRLPPGRPPIGGEIQIHGRGIDSNWTFGCIALRNPDMDELFAHPELGVGTRVLISGSALAPNDLEAILGAPTWALRQRGLDSPHRLGLFQQRAGLPVTCLPDRATLNRLHLGP